jgi:surface antigen
MTFHLRRLAARLFPLALAVGCLAVTSVATTAPAEAATMVRECKVTGNGCVSFTGYAGKSVWGYPVSSTGTNCVNYVAYRLKKNGVAQQSAMGNGGSWASNARKRGFRVDLTPKVGSIAQWNYGSAYAPSYGHVGYVEEVTSSYIVVSDNSYGGGYSSRWRVPKGDRNWPSNFIHFKDTAYQPPAPGSFLRVRETNEVYRLVGTAPVFVYTWAAFGGTKPTHLVSSTTLAALPARPTNGTFLRGGQTREVYRVVGGAPVFVDSWTAFGGTQPTTLVDQLAIDRAGSGGRWNHLLARPADGTVIRGGQRSEVYTVVGGAPVAVEAWANIGGYRTPTIVDQVAVDKAGSATRYNHLSFRPADGTILRTLDGKRYRVSAGVAAPTALTTGGHVTDHVAIANAGTGNTPRWLHLARATS